MMFTYWKKRISLIFFISCLITLSFGSVAGKNEINAASIRSTSPVYSGIFLSAPASSVGSMIINSYFPRNNAIVSDKIPVRVQVNSTKPVSSVTARIGAFKVELVLMSTSLGYPPNNYQNDLLINGYKYDDKLDLVILATDVENNKDSMVLQLIYDPPPVINILQPTDQSVARPNLPFRIRCQDRDTCNILIYFEGVPVGMNRKIVYSGIISDSMSAMIDMSAFNGMADSLRFDIWDKRLQHTNKGVFVNVDTSSALKTYYTGERYILDFNYNKLLLIDRTDMPVYPGIQDLALNRYSSIPLKFRPRSEARSYITPFGALLSGIDSTATIAPPAYCYEWNGDSIVSLGVLNSSYSLQSRNEFAAWSNGTKLMLRDLRTRMTRMVSVNATNGENDLTATGEVAYTTSKVPYGIMLYRNDSSTIVAPGSLSRWNVYPRTDGRRVVYLSTDTCCNLPRNEAIEYFDGKAISVLSQAKSYPAYFGLEMYACQNGNMAYLKPTSAEDIFNIWLMDTASRKTQVTFYPQTSRIESLNSKGDLVFISGKRRVYAPKYGPVQEIGTNIGTFYSRDSGMFISLGKSLFKVSLPAPRGLFDGFSGKREMDGNRLSWTSQQYVGSIRYEVQRSRDGRLFSGIGSVAVDNEPDKLNEYTYKDVSPPSTGNFYRLKMVYFDSTFRYGPVVALNNAAITEMDIYPNPVGSILNVNVVLAYPGRIRIQILSSDGSIVHDSDADTIDGILIKQIPVSFLRSGMYVIRFLTEKEVKVSSFIKI